VLALLATAACGGTQRPGGAASASRGTSGRSSHRRAMPWSEVVRLARNSHSVPVMEGRGVGGGRHREQAGVGAEPLRPAMSPGCILDGDCLPPRITLSFC
jgi:hypothetical protein